MLETSFSNNNETPIKNRSSNKHGNSSHQEISANNKQEFQNLVNKMILRLVTRTEADT